MADSQKVRIVRCPKCENLLPEPLGLSVYRCGGCGTVLRANKKVPSNDGFSEIEFVKRDLESCESFEHLSEQGSCSLGGASDSECDSTIMEQKERVIRSRRTYFSNSPIRTDVKKGLDDYERKSENETMGAWQPRQRTSGKEIDLVDNKNGQFLEQRIENWVHRCDSEKDPSLYDSESSSSVAYGYTIGTARSRENLDHRRAKRDMFTGYPENSMAIADRRVPDIVYPSERPSSSMDLFYGHQDDAQDLVGMEGLDPSRAELLRRLDELKYQIIGSREFSDKPRVVTDTTPIDPYYGRATYNVSIQSSTQNPQAVPHYFNQGNGTIPLMGHHHENSEGFLYPQRHVVNDIGGYEDSFQVQMTRKAHYPYPPQIPHELHPERFSDFKRGPLPSSAEDAFYHHHPTCSCSLCSQRNRPGPHQVPSSPISNMKNAKEPMKYRNDNLVSVGQKSFDSESVSHFPSQDVYLHSRQPSELDSDIDGFVQRRPRKAAVLHRNRKTRDAIAGGAPFIVCSSCLELLKMPRKLYKLENEWQELQCGACSAIISVKVDNRKLVISVPAETKTAEDPPITGSTEMLTTDAIKSLENSDDCNNSTETRHSKPLEDEDSNFGESDKQEQTSSCISRDDENTPADNSVSKDISESIEVPLKAPRLPMDSHSPILEHSNDPSKCDEDQIKHREGSKSEQNSNVDVTGASELVSFDDYSHTQVSQDSVATSKGENEEEDQKKSSKESESFFVGISNNLRDFSRSSEIVDSGRANVWVNGQPLPAHRVKKAEKLAGPILPGDYWYDYQAGFWGVMGHPCLGIIPPFIDEFTYPMPRNCAAGNTGIHVNGRELHKRDLDLLSSRGLPTQKDKFYRIDISGKVVDEDTGKELYNLGKLAPTIEKVKHGFGMKVPRSLK